jgi:phage-related tail protein
MALSDFDKAIYGYIVGKLAPKGLTRAAFKVAIGSAILTAQGLGRLAGPAAVRAAPFAGRALVNPYVGVPLAATAGTLALQQELERTGVQEEMNVARDEATAYLVGQMPLKGTPKRERIRKRQKSRYNRAVSAAMKAVKASSYHGKKGVITNPRKTFSTVSKTVSKINKGLKVANKGLPGLIKRKATTIINIGRPKQKRKKKRRSIYKPGRLA